MTESNPMRPQPSVPGETRLSCEAWESLLPEALDGTLSVKELAAFEEHSQECEACAQMLKDARQGADWLKLLEAPIEPPPELLDKILSRTSGQELPRPLLRPRPSTPSHLPVRPVSSGAWRFLESRSLRTAAMAFFSLALTLNLIDFKLSEVRVADLRPAALQAHLLRQYYAANAQVVRFYENTRFIQEMGALLQEMKSSSAIESPDSRRSPASRNDGGRSGTAGSLSFAMKSEQESIVHPLYALAENRSERNLLPQGRPRDRNSVDGCADAQAPVWEKGSAA